MTQGAARGVDGAPSPAGTGPTLVPAPPAQSGWDALELQAHLARLPPAQPCLACRSHDEDDDLVLIAPQLEKALHEGVADYRAVFACTLCGAHLDAPLRG